MTVSRQYRMVVAVTTPSIADTYLTIPELMRVARGSYKRAIDIQLAAGGLEDLPTTSGFLLAYLARDEELNVEQDRRPRNQAT